MSDIKDKIQSNIKNLGDTAESFGIPLWVVAIIIVILIISSYYMIRRYFKKNAYSLVVITRLPVNFLKEKSTQFTTSENRTAAEEVGDLPFYSELRNDNVSYNYVKMYSKNEFLTKDKKTLSLPFQNSGMIGFFVYLGNDAKHPWKSLMNRNYSHILSIQQFNNDIVVDQLDRECKFTDLNVNQSLLGVFLGKVYNELIITMKCSTDGTDRKTGNIKQWQKIMKVSNIVTIQSNSQKINSDNFSFDTIDDTTDINKTEVEGVYGNDVRIASDQTVQEEWKSDNIKCGYSDELDVMVSGDRIPFNQWTHIALNVTDKNVDLYVNGEIYKNYVFNEDNCIFKTNSVNCLDQVFAKGIASDDQKNMNVYTNTGYPILFNNNMKIQSNLTPVYHNQSLVYLGIQTHSSNVKPANVQVSRICYSPSAIRPGQIRMLSYKNPNTKAIHTRIRDYLYNWSRNVTSSENKEKLSDWFKDRKWYSDQSS